MSKGDKYYKTDRQKAKKFYRQADYLLHEASATKINKKKFTFNIKFVFKPFFGFLKAVVNLITVLIQLAFQPKQTHRKSN